MVSLTLLPFLNFFASGFLPSPDSESKGDPGRLLWRPSVSEFEVVGGEVERFPPPFLLGAVRPGEGVEVSLVFWDFFLTAVSLRFSAALSLFSAASASFLACLAASAACFSSLALSLASSSFFCASARRMSSSSSSDSSDCGASV